MNRLRVYGAALEQFEEFLLATEAVGPSVSPVPLYYALTQAGRAIAAAYASESRWNASGHGATLRWESEQMNTARLNPHPGESQFSAFCEAVGSSRLHSPVALGSIWASLQHLDVNDGVGSAAPATLPLSLRGSDAEGYQSAYLQGCIVEGLPTDAPSAQAELNSRLAAYPTASLGELRVLDAVAPIGSPSDRAVHVEWRQSDGQALDVRHVSSGLGPANSGWSLYPGLGTTADVLRPIALWWLLLLALSSIARYRPDRWVLALDRDRSVAAVPIEEA